MPKINVTFTGVDQHTALQELPRAHHIEYGVLFSTKRCFDSREIRYPNPRELRHILEYLAFHRTALHVCGSEARKMLLSNSGRNQLALFTDLVSRIQVNGVISLSEVYTICTNYPDHTIITQHTTANAHITQEYLNLENHTVLLDASGGEGKTPDQWIRPTLENCPVGFAGGLSPLNIVKEGQRILDLAETGDWIDMESGVRCENGCFSTDRVNDVLSWVEAD